MKLHEKKVNEIADQTHEQHPNTEARMQKQGSHHHQERQRAKIFKYLQLLWGWIETPVRWFYHLSPIEKFTAVLCVIGAIQFWAFVASERPFISISQIGIVNGEFKPDVPLAFILAVHNSGKTTAFVTDSRNIVRTQPSLPLERGLKKYMQETTAKGPVVAGDTNYIISRPMDSNKNQIILGSRAIAQLTEGSEQHLWVIGYITYKDRFPIFGVFSTTGYCFIYVPHPIDTRLTNFDRCGDEEYEYAN